MIQRKAWFFENQRSDLETKSHLANGKSFNELNLQQFFILITIVKEAFLGSIISLPAINISQNKGKWLFQI